MTNNTQQLNSDVLKSAWQRYAEFDLNASIVARRHKRLRQTAIVLAMAAVILAVLAGSASLTSSLPPFLPIFLNVVLIIILIVDFIILALIIQSHQRSSTLEMRAAAEEIKKEIYLYRTVLQWHEERDRWLAERLVDIQRHLADSLGSEFALTPYRGPLPPAHDANDPNGDPGFTRLLPAEYLRFRLEPQLQHFLNKIMVPKKNRTLLRVGLLATGGLSLLLATLGGEFSVWVAATVFAAAALISWLEPHQLESDITSHNQLVISLNIVRDGWKSLSKEEQTSEEFFKLVIAAEKVIWSHYNKHASEIWRAVDEFQDQHTDVLDEVLMLPATTTLFKDEELTAEEADQADVVSTNRVAIAENGAGDDLTKEESTLTVLETAEAIKPQAKPQKGLPHAFVVMPFGRKQGTDGRWLDFDSIYNDLIRPALEAAGFESFRADEESVSGDILTDMFQELLLADLVIADLSIDNANVFYELGVRHAIRKRGVVHIQSGRSYMPFDIFNVRTIPYHVDKNGRPAPEHLEKDRQAIIKITRETWASDTDRVHSPIFNLLDGLAEPDRRSLRTPLATGFWREYNEWRERVTIAQRRKRIGDILLLTEEISNPLIKEEAIAEAGRALQGMDRFELALQQYRHGLEINPRNQLFRRQEAFHLNRLGRTDEAIVKLERLLKDNPQDIEAISYLGRIYKQIWMETWQDIEDDQQRLQEAYASSHWLVKSVNTYLEGYRLNQNDYYPGINALTGSVLMDYLCTKYQVDDDPDVKAIRANLPKLKGALHFALESKTLSDVGDYWALASVGELEVSIAEDPQRVMRAYRKALTAARKNAYFLKSSLGQLALLESLSFRPEFVQAGMQVLQEEIKRIKYEAKSEDKDSPRVPPQVFIFAGHAIDPPARPEARFPTGMEKEVRQKIEQTLDKFKAGKNDLAVTAGIAAGGDIIFLEACLARDMKVDIHLPVEEARYIKEAVGYAGDQWIERFYAIRNSTDVTIRLQTEHLGPAKAGDDILERNARWALYTSLVYGIDRTRMIALWDGRVDGICGGPDTMIEQVRQLGGIAEHLNTTKFDYWKAEGKVSRALDILVQDL